MISQRIVCTSVPAKIGSSLYITVAAMTGHADAAMADATGGAVLAVDVSHECNGHSAMRPATPTNRSTDATTIWRSVQPAVVCSTGISSDRFCCPYRE